MAITLWGLGTVQSQIHNLASFGGLQDIIGPELQLLTSPAGKVIFSIAVVQISQSQIVKEKTRVHA